MTGQNSIIQSMWIGSALSEIEYLCIKSFIKNGHEFHLYTYNSSLNVPPETILKDANDIIPFTKRFTISEGFGAGSFAPFSDYFRLNLLDKKGGWWVDLDVICLKNFGNLGNSEIIATSLEIPEGDCANINVMHFPKQHPFISSCISLFEEMPSSEYYYAMGLDIVKNNIIKENHHWLAPHQRFNPISYRHSRYIFYAKPLVWLLNIYKYFKGHEKIQLPNKKSFALHIWNQTLTEQNINKNNSFNYFSLFEQLKRTFR